MLFAVALALAPLVPAGSLVPYASTVTKGGAPVVVVSAPESTWSVVQLHVLTTNGDLAPRAHADLEALASALADGQVPGGRSTKDALLKAGGAVRARVSLDEVVVSLGAPRDKLDACLRALDDLVKSRARLLPAAVPPSALVSVDEQLGLLPVAMFAPGHPYGMPLSSTGAPTAAGLKLAGDILFKRERVAVVVIGPDAAPDLLTRVQKTLTFTLPQNDVPPMPFALAGGTRLVELPPRGDVHQEASSRLWLLDGMRPPASRASWAVLARLTGAAQVRAGQVGGVRFDVALADVGGAAREERGRLELLRTMSEAPPPEEAVLRARDEERAARLSRLRDPDALADALGSALLLTGDAGAVEAEAEALARVTPDDVSAAARTLIGASRAIARTLPSTPMPTPPTAPAPPAPAPPVPAGAR